MNAILMRMDTLRVASWVALAALAAAFPLAIHPRYGWIATVVLATGGALVVARLIVSRYVEPTERLAEVVRPHVALPDAPAGELARLVAFEYRDAVMRLAEAESRARRRENALAHAGDGVVLIDAEGLVEWANPAARTLLHGHVLQLSRRLAEPQLDRLVADTMEGRPSVPAEITLRLPSPRPVLARAIDLGAHGVVLLLQDLSESYRLDRLRRDFVANVSHELKTPTAAIRALADVATDALADEDRDAACRFVERLRAQAERLADLVQDLLDLSRVEAGRELAIEAVSLEKILREAVERVRPVAELKRLGIEIDAQPVVVHGDRAQLVMAVHNLVDNAVRYSDEGTVRVSVSGYDGIARVEVSDEGIGIPADELPRIFERFYRVDKARSRATGGTGLGLAIVRHVAENHGGSVDVSSRLGEGSTFTLVLPVRSDAKVNAA